MRFFEARRCDSQRSGALRAMFFDIRRCVPQRSGAVRGRFFENRRCDSQHSGSARAMFSTLADAICSVRAAFRRDFSTLTYAILFPTHMLESFGRGTPAVVNSSTEMRWNARTQSDVCFNTATRSVRAIGLQAPLPSGTQGCEYISIVERSSPRLP